MYCTKCGSCNPDGNNYCHTCGQLLFHNPNSQGEWISSIKLKWKKPIVAIIIQSIVISAFVFFFVYGFYCTICGGIFTSWIIESNKRPLDNGGWVYNARWIDKVHDPLDLFPFIKTEYQHSTHSEEYIQKKFRSTMAFFIVFPSLLLLSFTVWKLRRFWIKKRKEPLPRDLSQVVENYNWCGFRKNKYIIFSLNNKYGILDAGQHKRIVIPAIYDSILWRQPNKTYDVTLAGKMQTFTINKTQHGNPIPKAEKDCTSS